MIPKIVYYCWFGGNVPQKVQTQIDSWKQILPDYQFIHINEMNFDYTKYRYTKKAYESKKFAFVSDVARLEFLLETGGIYLDTDVEVCQVFDPFLESTDLLLSMEYFFYEYTGVNVGTIIAPPEHPVLQSIHQTLISRTFTNAELPINVLFNEALPKLVYKNKMQYFVDERTQVFKAEVFCRKSKESITIHHFENSWNAQLSLFKKVKRFIGVWIKRIIGRENFKKLR